MAAQKGHIKTGGRVAGTQNKVTADLKMWIKQLLDNNTKQFEKDLKLLEPYQRVIVFEKLLSYSIPKQSAVSAQIEFNNLSDEQLDLIINELTKNVDYE